jgi:hypothetical protein
MIQKIVKKLVLKAIDETIGKKFPIIDELTDVFQEQEVRFKRIEKKLNKLSRQIKELKK